MGQSFVTGSQKEDSMGQFDDHIVELFDKLEVDFNIKAFDISTASQASDTLKSINCMLSEIKKKKKILFAASLHYS